MANEIRDAFNAAFADGPSGSPVQPVKSAIRAAGGAIQSALDTMSGQVAEVSGALGTIPAQITNLTGRVQTVEALASAGILWITQVIKVRATGNVNLAGGLVNGATLNGVVLATGDFVFLGAQTAPSQNGLYTVVASGTAARSSFADTAAELAHIGFVIQGGTVGTGERWTLPMNAGDITLGTTSLAFALTGVEPGYASEVQTARGGKVSLSSRLAAQGNTIADASVEYETIGAQVTPVDAPTYPSSGNYTFAKPISVDGNLRELKFWAKSTGTLKIRAQTQVGDNFTETRSATIAVVTTGLITLTEEDFGVFPVYAGEKLGFYALTGLLGQISGNTELASYYGATGADQPNFTDATVSFVGTFQISFKVAKRRAAGATVLDVIDTQGTLLNGLFASATAFSIGVASPATGSNASVATYVQNQAVAGLARLKTVSWWSQVASSMTFAPFTKSGNVFTQVGAGWTVNSAIGLNTLSLGKLILPGQCLGVTVRTAGGLAYLAGTDGAGWFQGTLDASSQFTDAAATFNQPLQFKFDLETLPTSKADRWIGKKLVFMGDSITAVAAGAAWAASLASYLGATVLANYAVAGRGIEDMLTGRVSSDFDNADCVTVFIGTNNFGSKNTPLGTIADSTATATFYGYYKLLLETLFGWKPTLAGKIFLITPLKRTNYTVANGNGFVLADYVNAVKAVGALYSCPVLDLHNTSGLNTINIGTLTSDGLHPTQPAGEALVVTEPAKAFFDSH